MLDDNFGGLDSYEIAEQKMLNNSDSIQHLPNTKKSLSGKQFRCMGKPISTRRMMAGFLVMIAWIVVFFMAGDGLDEDSLEYLIVNGSSIPVLIIAFAIWLGGKSK